MTNTRTSTTLSSLLRDGFEAAIAVEVDPLPPGFPGRKNDRNRPRGAGFEFRLGPGRPLKKAL